MAAPTWQSFSIQIPGKDFLKKARNILEALLVYLEVVKAFLETVKAFLIDFGNPLKVLIEALLNLINTLIESLKRTGVYALYDVPDPFVDPKLLRHVGGYQALKRRWKGSLTDAQDLNRPQPIKGALKGGFFMIVADANGPARLLALIQTLLKFFGGEFLKPKYQPPSNVRVVPVGEKGDPILQVTKVFTEQVNALAVEWSLPTTVPSADPAFQGLASELSQEFYPPSWLIERSEIPLNNEVPDTSIGDAAQAGQVVKFVDTQFITPKATLGFPANKVVPRKVRVKDQNGDPFIKFQAYAIISPGDNPANFFLGQLGTFRFIDTGVELDKTYFYRVRAFSGKLAFQDQAIGLLSFSPDQIKSNMNDGGSPYFEWPAADPGSPVVVGRPSAIVRGKVPKLNPKFNVPEVLRRLFLAAFSFNFHLPLPPRVPVKDGNGKDVKDAQGNIVYLPQFTPAGDPIPPQTTVEDIGKGTLTTLSGSIASFSAFPYISLTGSVSVQKYEINPATDKLPEMPWQLKRVRYAAARNMVKFSSFFLDVPASVLEGFRTLMQGPLPAGQSNIGTLIGKTTLEQMVYALTEITFTQSAAGKAASAVLETDVLSTDVFGESSVDYNTAATYGSAFTDITVRRNLLAAVNYLLSLASQGVPPNWIQISILRDLIPWSGQLLYDLLAKIQALFDAFKGVIEELKAFIDLLIRKIDTLERFIKFLIEILNYIESLSLGFYLLKVPGLDGDVDQWFEAIDTAQNEPPSTFTGYSASITFAYLAIDVAAFEAAFAAIF